MASRRKTLPIAGKTDAQAYGDFMRDLLAGTVTASALVETRAPDGGSRAVALERTDDSGNRLPPVLVIVPTTRLAVLQYDDPNG